MYCPYFILKKKSCKVIIVAGRIHSASGCVQRPYVRIKEPRRVQDQRPGRFLPIAAFILPVPCSLEAFLMSISQLGHLHVAVLDEHYKHP